MYRFFSSFILSLLLLSGCGAGPSSRLSDAQKNRLGQTLEAVGHTQQAPFLAQKNLPNPLNLFAETKSDAPHQMATKLLSAKCAIETPARPTALDQYKIKVAGPGCPVSMNFLVKYDLKETSTKGSIEVGYRVTEESFKKLNDIVAIEMKGSWGTEMDTTRTKVTGFADIRGSFLSTELGTLPVVVLGRSLQSEGVVDQTTTISVTYPTYTTELKATRRGPVETAKEEYFLNDQKISVSEYNDYIKKSGRIFPTASLTKSEAGTGQPGR